MSKLFYDHLIEFEEIEIELTKFKLVGQEKEEIHQMIEESIHYRVMRRILDHLPAERHQEFLEWFHEAPYHEDLLTFLKEKVENIEELIKEEISILKKELLADFVTSKSSQKA